MTTIASMEYLRENDKPDTFDLVVRGGERLDTTLLKDDPLPVILRLLGFSVLGLALYGFAVGLSAHLFEVPASSVFAAGRPVLWMPITFVAAFLGALSICLPSFYFYTQLSGIDASFRLVTAQALRVQTKTSVLLLGCLPVYLAAALASHIFGFAEPTTVLSFGIAVPFVLGLFGIRELSQSFTRLSEILPRTHTRPGKFIRRLVLAWGVVYSAVAPVALYRIAEALSAIL